MARATTLGGASTASICARSSLPYRKISSASRVISRQYCRTNSLALLLDLLATLTRLLW
jgi:hypothetical protein